MGPWGASVTLPRQIPLQQRDAGAGGDPRTFGVDRQYATKRSAYRHAAFEAYRYLHEVGLLNEHLLPLTSSFDVENEEVVKNLLKEVQRREGMTDVDSQINPWTAPANFVNIQSPWHVSLLTIGDLPPLHLLTKSQVPAWQGESQPVVYPNNSIPLRVTLQPTEKCIPCDDARLLVAREYTRRLFWSLCMSRMSWTDTDYCYLFLPPDTISDRWDQWTIWSRERHPDAGEYMLPRARTFGEEFSYPPELTVIKDGYVHSRAYQFVRWQHEAPVDLQDLEPLTTQQCRRNPGYEPKYPLLVVKPLPPKVNFLVPPPVPKQKNGTGTSPFSKEKYLDPDSSSVMLISPLDLSYATLLPSVLRALAMSITTHSFTNTLWPTSPLSQIQPALLRTALLAPAAGEIENYQRLETLGDTVLKFLSSFQLLAQYPQWHEGYLTKKRDHSVANVSLAKRDVQLGIFRWIIRGKDY